MKIDAKFLSSTLLVCSMTMSRPRLTDARIRTQGARAFLAKPLNVKELLELLDAVATDRDRDRPAELAGS